MRRRHAILISIPHGAAAGNMVRTGIMRRVIDSCPEAEFIVVSPMANDPQFADEINAPHVTLEVLPSHQPSGVEARLLALMQAAYIDSAITESVRIRRMEAQAKGTVRWIRAKRLLAQMVAPSMVARPTRYALSDKYVSHPWAEALFDRYEPVMVVTSNPGLILSEVPILRTAARRAIWAMSIDPSWDNFTNKLLPVRRVDRLVVWNDLMKQQAIELHGYSSEQLRVAGVPQWDRYFADGVTQTRDEFVRSIGADPARKLITVTTTPRELYQHHDHVLRVLLRAITENRLRCPAQVLVRLHPRDERSHYAPFNGVAGIIVEKPFRDTVRAADGLAVDVTTASQQHLANTLAHSDVIINVASTIAIEAAVFDTPVVNVAFDGEQDSDYVRSARRYYQFTHYINVTRHNAVRVAATPSALVDELNRYLEDPSLDAEGRRRVVREQCQFTDGRAAERVAQFVVDDLERVTSQHRAA